MTEAFDNFFQAISTFYFDSHCDRWHFKERQRQRKIRKCYMGVQKLKKEERI